MSWTKGRPTLDRTARERTLRKHPTCHCPGCPACTTRGCTKPSTEDDHVVPWFEGGTDADHNHQGMCSPCHSIKTKAEAARARARAPKARRKPEQHPGLT